MTGGTDKKNFHPGESRLLILGIGNVLLGDEGVGVKVIRNLENKQLPDHVDLLDGELLCRTLRCRVVGLSF